MMRKTKTQTNISKGNIIHDLLKQNVSLQEIAEITETSKNEISYIRDFQYFRLAPHQYYMIKR